jgi:hypothetical protein
MNQPPLSPEQRLTIEECAAIDQTLLPYQDRFAVRVAVYGWRCLREIAEDLGVAIAELNAQQITDWVQQDPTLQQEESLKPGFSNWYIQLLTSALNPLSQAAQVVNVSIEDLSLTEILDWFEQQAKDRLERTKG